MILFLDLRNGHQRLAWVGRESAEWLERREDKGEFAALEEARQRWNLIGVRPEAIAVAMLAGHRTDVSWSMVRTSVAMANALAFAWNVPAVTVQLGGDESPEEVLAAVRQVTVGIKTDARISAKYSGEPTITKPKI